MPGSPTRRRNWARRARRPSSKAASSVASSRVSAEEGRVELAGGAQAGAAAALGGRLREPGPHRLLLALDRERLELVVGDGVPGQLVRELADDDAAGRRGGLEAGRRVDGVAGEEGLARGGVDVGVQVGLAGVHADAHLDRVAVGPGQRADFVDEPKRAAHGPLGVVLVRLREAEHGEHGVADELLDGAAVLLDEPPRQGVVLLQEAVDQLVVGGLGVGGEADEVAEQGGDDLALLGESPWGRQAGAAIRAELEALRCLGSA